MVIGTVFSIVLQLVAQLQAAWEQQHHVYVLYLKYQMNLLIIPFLGIAAKIEYR